MELINFTYIIGDGDWGLGIGDWAQSPIRNPQSPIVVLKLNNNYKFSLFIKLNNLNLVTIIN